MATKIFTLNNLDCPHCAAKIEQKINTLPEIESAVFTFATKKLVVESEHSSDLLSNLLQQTCDSIEDGVTVELSEEQQKKSAVRQKNNETRKELLEIGIGMFFFAVALTAQHILYEFYPIRSLELAILYVIPYLILGYEILVKSFKNILKGQLFDENFLMSIATLGAFAIKEFPEAVGVVLFFRIGELFQKIAVEKSRSQIMDAVDLRAETVNLVSGNDTVVVPVENAKIGDILLVRVGERIPLDATVVEGESRIDTSAVTGESVPRKVTVGENIFSGCINMSNVIKIRVEKELKESMVTKILNSVENAAAGKPKMDMFITRFSKVYTPIVVLLALFTAVVIPLFTDRNFTKWIYTALSFLVMSCPCALVLSVPLAFFCGIGASSKIGILFKNGMAMEVLTRIKCVVMDKTGTVTKGTFEVQKIVCETMDTEEELLQLCASCEQYSTHPIAGGILACAEKRNLVLMKSENVEEISGMGMSAVINGKNILCGNRKLMKKFYIAIPDEISQIVATQVIVAIDGKYAGYILIADTVKENAEIAIKQLKKRNIFTAILTGDEENNAKEVAETIGADEYYAKLMPQDKLEKLNAIRTEHGNVMFVGDGINDAPVLAGADVGCAMGSGSDSAIEVADVVFMNSDIISIPKAITIAEKTNTIAKQNVIFAITIKVIVIILGITGLYANMWLAVFADTGVAVLCIVNSVRMLFKGCRL